MPLAISFVSSESDSHLPMIWQCEQLTPNSALHPQFIIHKRCSAETLLFPFITFIFLNTESAGSFSIPFIDAITWFIYFNLSASRLSLSAENSPDLCLAVRATSNDDMPVI